MSISLPNKDLDHILTLISKNIHLKETLYNCITFKLGKAWIDKFPNPTIALYVTPAFCFLNGDYKSSSIQSLLKHIPENYSIIIPNQEWEDILKQFWKEKLYFFQRTEFSSKNLIIEHIMDLKARLPEKFDIKKLNLEIAKKLDKHLARLIPLMFENTENFIKKGVGFCAFHESKAVCMASSFTPFDKTLEIQIDTLNDPRYRRKGLATATSAFLLEYCLENNIIPHWDAANDISHKLALKLGFTDPVKYNCYFWSNRTDIWRRQEL